MSNIPCHMFQIKWGHDASCLVFRTSELEWCEGLKNNQLFFYYFHLFVRFFAVFLKHSHTKHHWGNPSANVYRVYTKFCGNSSSSQLREATDNGPFAEGSQYSPVIGLVVLDTLWSCCQKVGLMTKKRQKVLLQNALGELVFCTLEAFLWAVPFQSIKMYGWG